MCHTTWYGARTTARDLWHPCPDCALCITPGRLYDPTSCPPCQTFLADMRQNPSPSSLAHKTWVKWNRTLVNRWKKNNVALYSPSNVRMLLWADATLFSSYEAVLPPAPPSPVCIQGESAVGRPVDHLAGPSWRRWGDQDQSSPWSSFDDDLPPNQEARPATPLAPTPPPPPESAPGPSSLPLPTQPPSDPTLALLMNMMSTFQSEMKSLRSDFLIFFCSGTFEFLSHHICYTALTPYGPVSFATLSCCDKFWGSLFHQALPNPAPPAMPPQPTLPMAKELAGVPQPGSSGPHCSQVLASHSVLPHCVHMSCCYSYAYILAL